MKLIIAIVRPEKLNDVLEALFRAEVRGLTVSGVRCGLLSGRLERGSTAVMPPACSRRRSS